MSADSNEFITVVSGLPRSGTSMMMRMLESGGLPVLTDGFRTADADNPRGYYEYEAVKRLNKDSSWLPEAYGRAIKVIYVLLYTLPPQYQYKVMFIRRDLAEVIASQKKMLERRREEQILRNDQLAALFEQQLQKLYGWISTQKNMTCLFLNHGDVLARPEEAAGLVNAFLGLDLHEDAMVATVDPTLHRNRSTVGV